MCPHSLRATAASHHVYKGVALVPLQVLVGSPRSPPITDQFESGIRNGFGSELIRVPLTSSSFICNAVIDVISMSERGAIPEDVNLTAFTRTLNEVAGKYEQHCKAEEAHVALWRSDYRSLWEYEKNLFASYPDMLQECKCIPNESVFMDIAVWKLGPWADFQHLFSNTAEEIRSVTCAAFEEVEESTVESALRTLSDTSDGLSGIGPAAATALITVYDYERDDQRFTIMDQNTLEVLSEYGFNGLPDKADISQYRRYRDICRELMEETDADALRELDRRLWYLGKER